MMLPRLLLAIVLFSIAGLQGFAQTLEEIGLTKKMELEALVAQAKEKGISTIQEELSIRTADVFWEYANWDEANVALNESYFDLVVC